jgi:hypothetical protein
MLRMEDRLYAHPTYLKGVSGAISAYLQLHDSAAAGGGPGGEEALLAAMSAEEQKKWVQACTGRVELMLRKGQLPVGGLDVLAGPPAGRVGVLVQCSQLALHSPAS